MTNDTVADLEQRIREYVTTTRSFNRLSRKKATWFQICSALDAIGDTEVALHAFRTLELPDDTGLHYITTYGVLQLLYVQQDAVEILCKLLHRDPARAVEIAEVRNLRNCSIGHPVRTKDGASHFISRFSLSRNYFEFMTTSDAGKNQITRVHLLDIIGKQQGAAAVTLKEVLRALQKEDGAHRQKFQSTKLADIFHCSTDYLLGKLLEGSRGESAQRNTGQAALKELKKYVGIFKGQIEKRQLKGSGAWHALQELRYPLETLTAYFDDPSHQLAPESAYIFAFFVDAKISELRKMAAEIDADYNERPRGA